MALSEEGYFTTELTDTTGVTPSLESVLATYQTLYVGLTVANSTGEISPRQKILHTPHAVSANSGVPGFSVNGTATVTTLQAGTVKQKAATDGSYYDLLPRGVIVMWYGSQESVPAGWALCDGKAHTAPDGSTVTPPDLRGRFIVGTGASEGNGLTNYALEEKGGEEKHTLGDTELPSHRHYLPGNYGDWQVVYMKGGTTQRDGWAFVTPKTLEYSQSPNDHQEKESTIKQAQLANVYSGYTGNGDAHENRPPYFALAYIMKL